MLLLVMAWPSWWEKNGGHWSRNSREKRRQSWPVVGELFLNRSLFLFRPLFFFMSSNAVIRSSSSVQHSNKRPSTSTGFCSNHGLVIIGSWRVIPTAVLRRWETSVWHPRKYMQRFSTGCHETKIYLIYKWPFGWTNWIIMTIRTTKKRKTFHFLHPVHWWLNNWNKSWLAVPAAYHCTNPVITRHSIRSLLPGRINFSIIPLVCFKIVDDMRRYDSCTYYPRRVFHPVNFRTSAE